LEKRARKTAGPKAKNSHFQLKKRPKEEDGGEEESGR
jgi:hypothetical protein